MRAAIYARYSSDQQRAASIEDQVRVCKEHVARAGWELVQVFQDRALSGSNMLRPGLQALLAGAREAGFDFVAAEALDRLSRDQEDVASLFKRLSFAGIKIVTLAEGEINELHVGLKGTMNALFLKDLADKTRRGLRGRVEAGKSGGGNAFGYRVIRQLAADGTPIAGEREIDRAQAAVVIHILEAYAVGTSPKKIAMQLNADCVPGPRGGAWSATTINGNRERGTGILNNELYVGRLVWNRLRYGKDPETGRRRSRPNTEGKLVTADVPELRIVPQPLWDAVRERQAGQERNGSSAGPTDGAFWSKQRPRYLFSGLIRCGVCGAGFSKSGARHFGCSGARNKGPTVCTNRSTIRQDVLDATVLDGLRSRMMDPALFKVFADEFTAEWNRMQAGVAGERSASQAELQRVLQQIERLVDALADGTLPPAAVSSRIRGLEARRVTIEGDLADRAVPAPRLHPNLAGVYRDKIAELADVLAHDNAQAAREAVRSMVDEIVLMPEDTGLRVEVHGELAAILGLAGAGNDKSPGVDTGALASQIKMVAGTGFEPVTFRL